MLSYFDAVICFIAGGLIVNPRRFSSRWRATGAWFLAGAATTLVYLLVTRPGWHVLNAAANAIVEVFR